MNIQQEFSLLLEKEYSRQAEKAWERFMSGEEVGEGIIRPEIKDSWHRVKNLGVNPYLSALPAPPPSQSLTVLREESDLFCQGVPVVDQIAQASEREDVFMALADNCGYILRLAGGSRIIAKVKDYNVAPGSCFEENLIGTNVSTLARRFNKVAYVCQFEYYCHIFHSLVGLAAPIHHPVAGNLLGLVIIAGHRKALHSRAMNLTTSIAEMISKRIGAEEKIRQLTLVERYQEYALKFPSDAVLAIDRQGHIAALSPSITQFSLPNPQNALSAPVSTLGLELIGFKDLSDTQYSQLWPHLFSYDLKVHLKNQGATYEADAIIVLDKKTKRTIGTLLIFPSPAKWGKGRPISGERPPLPDQEKRDARVPTPRQKEQSALYTFADLVGEDPAFKKVVDLARKVAPSDLSVLILGESGTGKELLAHALHNASPRRNGPFVAFSCGGASEDLIAAELFGYVEGAFTGAVKGGRPGKVELAHGGTLFLDEVGTMPVRMQEALLRVLEERRILRVGGVMSQPLDMRVITATNADLEQMVTQGKFRFDLYYRLNVFPIILPPLRDRKEDIRLLVQYFLSCQDRPLSVTPEAMALLLAYPWPGNVRELRNVLLRAAALTSGPALTPEDLSLRIEIYHSEDSLPQSEGLRLIKGGTEREAILTALRQAKGKVTEAAGILGIHRVTLFRKMREYGFKKVHYLELQES